jgi:tetratricopeptide (TPR) repeat protein
MYLLTGERLGLKLVPISIPGLPFVPGHAALDMLDGSARIQIEPTNPDGFDWLTKSKRPGVRVIGFVPDRKKGHETDALGIAASIYTNRGVALNKEEPPQHLAAIRCDLAALALDPTDETATNNLISDFVNWGPVLQKEKKFAEGVRVLAFGKSVSPPSNELTINLTAALQSHIDVLLAASQDREALAVIEEGAELLPSNHEFKSPARWFARRANLDQEEAGWEAGLAVIRRGLTVVADKEKKELAKARTSFYRQWSQSLLEKEDLDGSVKVLREAVAAGEPDDSLKAGIAYHTATALKVLDKAGGEKLAEHFELLKREFPAVKQVTEAGFNFAMSAIQDLGDAEKFPEAIAAAKRYQPLAASAEKQAELGAYPYDLWGRNLAEKKEWQSSYDKYAEGLKAFPKQPRLVQNLVATLCDWAEPEMDAQRWDEAIRIYDLGLALLPDHATLKLNRKFCVDKKAGN